MEKYNIDSMINTICELHGIKWSEAENYSLLQFYKIVYFKSLETAKLESKQNV